MPIPKLDDAINDFSAGELDPDVKRSGSPLIKMGGRQMLNWRVLNSHKKTNRPGRSALSVLGAPTFTRIEEISIKGMTFAIGFAPGEIGIINAMGNLVFISTKKGDGTTNIPWTAATLGGITYAIIGLSIYIAYPDGAPNNVPQILTWDGVSQTSTWALSTYAETLTPGGQKRTAFYRLSPPGITLAPSASSGNIAITFSSNVLVAGMVGTKLTYCNRELQIKTVTSGTVGTATVIEPLPPAQTLTLGTHLSGTFNLGDVVKGSVSGAQGIITATPTTQAVNCAGVTGSLNVGDSITGAPSGATGTILSNDGFNDLTVLLGGATPFAITDTLSDSTSGGTASAITRVSGAVLTAQLFGAAEQNTPIFSTSDLVVGPSASSDITAVSLQPPQPVALWANELMNTFRGYPSSVFGDQSRLGFCNIPAKLSVILWSAIDLPLDLYIGAQPGEAIFEIAPDQATVLYVMAGMESSEFVFTDRAIYYIPINATNPLKPGSVAFNKLSDFGCMPNVQPRRAEQTIVYMKAGGVQVGAVQAPGAYYRPYIVDSISEMHSHLFKASPPVAIAIPSGPTQFEELYLYIALANGTLVVGRYTMRNGLLEPGPEGKPSVGWVPWNGAGSVNFVSAVQGTVLFTTNYAPNGITPVNVLEFLDATQYIDAAVSVNNPPIALQAGQPAHSSLVGNMTADGGLAAAFNGTRVQGAAASAVIGAAMGFVGEQFTTPQTIGQALIWPPSDTGFETASGPISLALLVKQTAPAGALDGTVIATTTLLANQTTGPVVLTPNYSTQTWAYAWIVITGTSGSLGIAQVLFQKGPLWWLANGTVTLIDNGTRFMGTYQVDANGNIIPQFIGSENLASPNLVAGQPWTAVFEPFMPHAPSGSDQQQRMRRRKVAKGLVSVENSTGFVFGTRRVPAYFVGEDATQPAKLREFSYQIRPRGRKYDPRLVLTKDTPGPLIVVEYGFEVTV